MMAADTERPIEHLTGPSERCALGGLPDCDFGPLHRAREKGDIVKPALGLLGVIGLLLTGCSGGVDYYTPGQDQVGLLGYDPVSYFEGASPKLGSQQITAEHDGQTYWFASKQNRDEFVADPAKFLPAYDGWCAYAIAQGQEIAVDPLNFKVTGGRLFLFYRTSSSNPLDEWNKDEATRTAKADEEWTKLAK